MARLSRDSISNLFEDDFHPELRLVVIGASTQMAPNDSEITPQTADRVIKALSILEAQSGNPITILLNSPGGDIYAGLAIYDAVKRCPCEVTILATGQCMSAASIILQAADTRQLTPNCVVMVHDGQEEFAGHPKDMARWSKLSDKISQVMYGIYAKRSGKPAKYWEKKCAQDYILLPSEAIAEGLADEIL